MQHAPRTRSAVVLVVALTLAGCGDSDTDDDRLDPDGQSVIDRDIDEDTVITDPGGLTNQLDGDDGDIEDQGAVVDD